jgi:hypothetical protein
MADDKGRPIHEPARSVSPIGGVPANVDPNAPKCVACFRYHGGTNEGIRCLEDEVRRLRGVVEAQQKNLRGSL